MNTNTTDTRPLAERITQGPMHVYKHEHWWPTVRTIADKNILDADCSMSKGEWHENMPEAMANAELVTEAFNVTHETKRTPHQLADERAELIAALTRSQELLQHCYDHGKTGSQIWEHFPAVNNVNFQLLTRLNS